MATPFPNLTEWVKTNRWLSDVASRWLTGLTNAVNASAQQVGAVTLSAQHASVTTTAVQTPKLTQGLYRLTYYLRKTVAATVSSSTTVTLGWTDGAIACSQTFAALTTNTTAAVDAQVWPFVADAGSTITYAIAYASSGATAMKFAFDLSVEMLP